MQVPSPLPNPTSSEAMSSSPPTRVHTCGPKPGLEVEKRGAGMEKIKAIPSYPSKNYHGASMVTPWWHPGITMV